MHMRSIALLGAIYRDERDTRAIGTCGALCKYEIARQCEAGIGCSTPANRLLHAIRAGLAEMITHMPCRRDWYRVMTSTIMTQLPAERVRCVPRVGIAGIGSTVGDALRYALRRSVVATVRSVYTGGRLPLQLLRAATQGIGGAIYATPKYRIGLFRYASATMGTSALASRMQRFRCVIRQSIGAGNNVGRVYSIFRNVTQSLGATLICDKLRDAPRVLFALVGIHGDQLKIMGVQKHVVATIRAFTTHGIVYGALRHISAGVGASLRSIAGSGILLNIIAGIGMAGGASRSVVYARVADALLTTSTSCGRIYNSVVRIAATVGVKCRQSKLREVLYVLTATIRAQCSSTRRLQLLTSCIARFGTLANTSRMEQTLHRIAIATVSCLVEATERIAAFRACGVSVGVIATTHRVLACIRYCVATCASATSYQRLVNKARGAVVTLRLTAAKTASHGTQRAATAGLGLSLDAGSVILEALRFVIVRFNRIFGRGIGP